MVLSVVSAGDWRTVLEEEGCMGVEGCDGGVGRGVGLGVGVGVGVGDCGTDEVAVDDSDAENASCMKGC